jgi:GntR family transcriptional regulator/MocR family aminotransferase
VTNHATKSGTNYGPELLFQLRGGRRRAQLEDRLRELVREGTLPAGSRLPSSRELAGDLGVSRRLVVDAYAQLLAEGYLLARPGSGTYVAATAGVASGPLPRRSTGPPRLDFFPGAPDLASFPRALWLRVVREVLQSVPPRAFAYPDVRGAPELRRALAAYLRRVRGVVADPGSIVICSGATQGLALLGRVLARMGAETIAVEDPCLPPHRAVLAYAGLRVRGMPVDEEGLDVDALRAPTALGTPAHQRPTRVAPATPAHQRPTRVAPATPAHQRPTRVAPATPAQQCPTGVVLTTPAHQCPTGVVLSPRRRSSLVEWARAGGLVIEDDYDAEFRYDRAPLGALQGLAPDRVVYLGTVSKTLAPGLRLGWLVLPASLLDAVVEAKLLDDLGSPTIDQLVLARLIETAAYDRHLRKARRRNRARRDALIAAVAQSLPRARISGISAGLHALVRLPRAVDTELLMTEAARRSLGVYPLGMHMIQPPPATDALVLGYAGLSEAEIDEGIRRLAAVLEDCEVPGSRLVAEATKG